MAQSLDINRSNSPVRLESGWAPPCSRWGFISFTRFPSLDQFDHSAHRISLQSRSGTDEAWLSTKEYVLISSNTVYLSGSALPLDT